MNIFVKLLTVLLMGLLTEGCFLFDCQSRNLVGPTISGIKYYRYFDFFSDTNFKNLEGRIDSAYIKKPHLNPVDNRYQLLSSLTQFKYETNDIIDYTFPYFNKSNKWIVVRIENNDPYATDVCLFLLKSETHFLTVSALEWDSLKVNMKKPAASQILYSVVESNIDSVRLTYREGKFYTYCDLTEKERLETINTFEKNILPYLNVDLDEEK